MPKKKNAGGASTSDRRNEITYPRKNAANWRFLQQAHEARAANFARRHAHRRGGP